MTAPIGRTLTLIVCGFVIMAIAKGLDSGWLKSQSKQSNVLRIALRQSQNDFGSLYEENGFDQDLFEAFAAEKGYQTEYLVTDSTQESIRLLENDDADLALGIRHSESDTDFRQSAPYTQVQPLIACRADIDMNKLYQKRMLSILLPDDHNLESAARVIKKTYPAALYLHQKGLNVGDALAVMHTKKIDCALSQERLFKINKLAFPRMKASMIVGSPIEISAYFSNQAWTVSREFGDWLKTKSAQVQLRSLKEKYFGFFEIFDAYEVEIFEKRIESRLRQYIPFFKEAAQKTGIAWELLASIAYQESHWDPQAKSFTGVRGLMMLTKATAKEMGVSDRVDPRRSIIGGAQYLSKIMKRLPKEIPDHEKIFFALASYNVGLGHVQDAQTLVNADEAGSWHALKEKLPLLSKRHVYRKLRYGKARGKEPVVYVQRIRKFQKLLSLAFASPQEPVKSEAVWADNTTTVMN